MNRYGTDNDAIVRLVQFKVSRLARETTVSALVHRTNFANL